MRMLEIEWSRGRMTICLNTFFPTTKANVKKLLGIIDLDDPHRDRLAAQLERYFREKVLECELAKMAFAREAAHYGQAAEWIKRRIETGVSVIGAPLSETGLKSEKDAYKYNIRAAKNSLMASRRYSKLFDQFMGYLEILSRWKGRL